MKREVKVEDLTDEQLASAAQWVLDTMAKARAELQRLGWYRDELLAEQSRREKDGS